MISSQVERREFQRLLLDPPIAARLGSAAVRIVDLGVMGASVEGAARVPLETPCILQFESARGPITLQCEVVHGAGTSRAGLRILSAAGGSDATLRQLLIGLVTAAIERLRRSAAAPAATPVLDLEGTAMRVPVPYLSLRLENGLWRKRGAFIPIQPENGFTIPASEDPAEVTRLMSDYEQSGEEGRQLLRLFAELRVCEGLRVPPGA